MSAGGGEDELNLVPFIDLFSVLICFLLMTAVWMNIDSLSVDSRQTTAAPDDEPPPEPPKPKIPLRVTLMEKELELAKGEEVTKIPLVLDANGRPNLDEFLGILSRWRESFPERKDVVLNTEDAVLYQTMISVFDTLIGQGWTEVGVSTQ